MGKYGTTTFEVGKIYASPKTGAKVLCTEPTGVTAEHFTGVLLKDVNYINHAFERGFHGNAWKKDNFLLNHNQTIAV